MENREKGIYKVLPNGGAYSFNLTFPAIFKRTFYKYEITNSIWTFYFSVQ